MKFLLQTLLLLTFLAGSGFANDQFKRGDPVLGKNPKLDGDWHTCVVAGVHPLTLTRNRTGKQFYFTEVMPLYLKDDKVSIYSKDSSNGWHIHNGTVTAVKAAATKRILSVKYNKRGIVMSVDITPTKTQVTSNGRIQERWHYMLNGRDIISRIAQGSPRRPASPIRKLESKTHSVQKLADDYKLRVRYIETRRPKIKFTELCSFDVFAGRNSPNSKGDADANAALRILKQNLKGNFRFIRTEDEPETADGREVRVWLVDQGTTDERQQRDFTLARVSLPSSILRPSGTAWELKSHNTIYRLSTRGVSKDGLRKELHDTPYMLDDKAVLQAVKKTFPQVKDLRRTSDDGWTTRAYRPITLEHLHEIYDKGCDSRLVDANGNPEKKLAYYVPAVRDCKWFSRTFKMLADNDAIETCADLANVAPHAFDSKSAKGNEHHLALWAVFMAGTPGHAFNIVVGPELQVLAFEPQHGTVMHVNDKGEYVHPRKGTWEYKGKTYTRQEFKDVGAKLLGLNSKKFRELQTRVKTTTNGQIRLVEHRDRKSGLKWKPEVSKLDSVRWL